MLAFHFRGAFLGAAIALLSLWPETGPQAKLLPAETPEPLVAQGTPGHSVAHARISLREISAERAAARKESEGSHEEVMPEHEPPWKNLPLPSGARVLREVRRSSRLQVTGVTGAPSPPPASSFQALLDDGRVIPPDTDGAVGPNHVVTMLNSQVRVHDRSGRDLITTTLTSFWTKVSGNFRVSDPHIEYDPATDRWIVTAIAFTQAVSDSSVLVGVSQGGDPTGTWNLYRIVADTGSLLFADFPTLGFNRDWIVVQVNMYGFPQTDPTAKQQLLQTQIYAFDKGNMLAGGADARHTLFSRADLGASQAPAVTYDAGLPVVFLLEEWNGNFNGTGYLRLYSIGGPVGSEVLSSVGFPATDDVWDFGPPANGDFGFQKDVSLDSRTGKPIFVQTGNSDFSHVVFRNGMITAAHTVFLPAGGATRSAIQWWQLTMDGAVVQRGRLDDATGRTTYAYSSIAPNRNNDLLLGYTSFSDQQYPSGGYAFRAAGDPPGTLRAPALLKAGESTYTKTFGSGRNRWGDYSLSAVDPANDTDLWTIQEYAALPPQPSPVSYWGTWWGRVVPDSSPSVALPVAGFSSSADATLAGQPVAFSDTSAGASGWFWNFGDGTASSARNPVHAFLYSGTFSVVLTAVNQTGATTATHSITVAPPARVFPEPISKDRVPRQVTPHR